MQRKGRTCYFFFSRHAVSNSCKLTKELNSRCPLCLWASQVHRPISWPRLHICAGKHLSVASKDILPKKQRQRTADREACEAGRLVPIKSKVISLVSASGSVYFSRQVDPYITLTVSFMNALRVIEALDFPMHRHVLLLPWIL